MAGSINKASVREQFDEIKEDFNQRSKAGEVPKDLALLFKSLFMLFEIVLSVFMEKQTKKTGKNSSIPSSQTEPDETSNDPNQSGRHSKRRKNTKGSFSNQSERTTQRTIKVNSCDTCGEGLSDQEPEAIERRTLIDIVFYKVTQHHDAEIKTCGTCETVNKGRFPRHLQGPLQYGKGLKAYLLNLIIVQMVSLNRVQQMAFALIGQMISEAVMLKYVIQLHIALERWQDESIDLMLKQAVINTDETSLKVNKKNQWIHVYSSGDTVLKFLHSKRGKEAINDIGIIPKYSGTIVHDCWASYLSYGNCSHGLCGSHLLRELTFIVDSNDYRWAKNMKRLLKHACKLVAKRKRKKLTPAEYQKLLRNYRNIITRGGNELPPIPPKPKTQRGRIAKSDAHNLWERLRDHEEAVLLFAKISEVPFTNNRAERDLRMSKVKQKVSGCFRTEKYARAFCRISSYLQTMTNKGYHPLAAIEMALSGEIYSDRV